MDKLLLYYRIFLEALCTLIFTGIGLLLTKLPTRMRITYGGIFLRYWCMISCRIFNIHIHLVGPQRTVRPGTLIVANHISYWDIFVLGALFPAVFLSKMEIRDLPIVGKGASLLGTLFVDRTSVKSGVRSIREIHQVLQQGISVISFPEGTTSSVEEVMEFKAGLFKPATMGRIPIQTVALTYRDFDSECWGDEPMGDHLLRNARNPRHTAFVTLGNQFYAYGESPQETKDKAYTFVEAAYAKVKQANVDHANLTQICGPKMCSYFCASPKSISVV